jgi:carboxypeptidase Taq
LKKSAYNQLLDKTKDSILLSTASGIIHWDMETMMPPGAVEQRSQQLALLSRIHHKLATDPQIGKLLAEAQASPDYQAMGQVEKRNIYLIDKSYREQTALPETLVSQIAQQEALTVNIWKKAKAQKNYGFLKAELQNLFELKREAAEILLKIKQTRTAYEALIDDFEPNMTAATISTTFSQLLAGLKPLIQQVEDCQTQPATKPLSQHVPTDNQRSIAKLLTQTLGYDTQSNLACGRVDETEHPFTSGCYDDVRITTHYFPDNFASSVFSVLHETGHALYERGLNPEWKYQPVGSTCSYGIHESQSRFYENIVGRSKEFWTVLLPDLRVLAPSLSNVQLEPFVRAINRVERSKIRIEADEVTYSLHIIVRFELERDLFAGKISFDELPQVWNQKYSDYLGVKIGNDSEGVMQDTHWASGLYGYFPSYALGNIYSGQINAALTEDLPEWRRQLTEGKLDGVNGWLREKIYGYGDLYDPEDLIFNATGTRLNAQPYLEYLREKYGALYGF